MRINEICAKGVPPIGLFTANQLSDVVVLAGPNGVGKTRLMNGMMSHLKSLAMKDLCCMKVVATCAEEEEQWGQEQLDTSKQHDAKKLRATLKKTRRRGNWKSSILNFESNRTIQKVAPFAFTWEVGDPYDEEIGWNTTFNPWHKRYQDTLHSIFRLIESHKRKIANLAIKMQRDGETEMGLNFADPMESFKKVFEQLLGPKTLVDPSASRQRLQFQDRGEVFSFASLSSGEREVVNVAFDFLLREPSDCVVFFDEPELHLHPELSYRLIRTLQSIGSRNQFIFCTHSPEIISSSLNQSVIFVAPPGPSGTDAPLNQARIITEDDETNQALRLLGHSLGTISLGKKIVLIEGTQASLDKQTYGSIIENRYPELVLVPSEGVELVASFETMAEKVLSQTLWGIEFFMLCDGDCTLFEKTERDESSPNLAKLRRLDRYHLENYFLEEDIWEKVFRDMEASDSWLRSQSEIRQKMKELARETVSYAVALAVSASVRQAVGNVSIMPKGCHGKSKAELQALISERAEVELERVSRGLEANAILGDLEDLFSTIIESLDNDTDDWKRLLPGRPLLNQFAAQANLDISRAKRLYIREALRSDPGPFEYIDRMFQSFAAY